MHWEEDFFWQEDEDEKRWCFTCCECDELNFSEQPGDHDCEDRGDDGCQPGHQMWLRDCDDDHGETFQAKTFPDGVLLQIVGDAAVCLTRTKQRYVTVQPCNALDAAQKWRPISAESEFQLRPAYFHRNDDGRHFCVTQHHHPKDEEILGLKDCPQAELWDTSEYDAYFEL